MDFVYGYREPEKPKRKSRGKDHIFDNIWKDFIDACGGGCVECKRTGFNLDKGHIIPYRHNGPDHLENRQPMCAWCNNAESVYHPMQDYRPKDWRERFVKNIERRFLGERKSG